MRHGGHQPLRRQPGGDGRRRRADGGDCPAGSRRRQHAPDEDRAVSWSDERSALGVRRRFHPGSAAADQDGAPAAQVLALINQARAAAGCPH